MPPPLHEMAHSTGKELGRDQHGVFGTEDYAMEEFVAELSCLCLLHARHRQVAR